MKARRIRNFNVRMESRTLLRVLRLAAAEHGRRRAHDPMKCKDCEALDRLEEELVLGDAMATPEASR